MIEIAAAVVLESGHGGPGERVLVAKRPPGVPRGGLGEFPGGKAEPGEPLAEAASREVREEVGCEIEILGVIAVGEEVDLQARREPAVRVHAFRASRRDANEPRPLASDEVRWVDGAELATLAMPAANRAIVAAVLTRLAGDPHSPEPA